MTYALLTPLALFMATMLALPVWRTASLPSPRRRVLALIIGICVVMGSLGLYTLLGAPAWVEPIDQQRQEQAQLRTQLRQYSQKAQTEPENAENWRLLGTSWLKAENPGEAVVALRHAVLASGGQPDIIAEYAAALVMKNNGAVNEEAVASIAMALKLDPQQPLARKLETLWHEQQAAAKKQTFPTE